MARLGLGRHAARGLQKGAYRAGKRTQDSASTLRGAGRANDARRAERVLSETVPETVSQARRRAQNQAPADFRADFGGFGQLH